MITKTFGKITNCGIGYCGYQRAGFGAWFILEGGGFGCGDDWWFWGTDMNAENTKWTENERQLKFGEVMTKVNNLMRDAKVKDFDQLAGKPIEITSDGNRMVSWRILTEVL